MRIFKVFMASLVFLFLSAAGARAAGAEGVSVGGNVRIDTETGDRSATAEGDGSVARTCVGSVTGATVKISGNVTINGNSDPSAGCDCVGDCPETEKKTTGQSE